MTDPTREDGSPSAEFLATSSRALRGSTNDDHAAARVSSNPSFQPRCASPVKADDERWTKSRVAPAFRVVRRRRLASAGPLSPLHGTPRFMRPSAEARRPQTSSNAWRGPSYQDDRRSSPASSSSRTASAVSNPPTLETPPRMPCASTSCRRRFASSSYTARSPCTRASASPRRYTAGSRAGEARTAAMASSPASCPCSHRSTTLPMAHGHGHHRPLLWMPVRNAGQPRLRAQIVREYARARKHAAQHPTADNRRQMLQRCELDRHVMKCRQVLLVAQQLLLDTHSLGEVPRHRDRRNRPARLVLDDRARHPRPKGRPVAHHSTITLETLSATRTGDGNPPDSATHADESPRIDAPRSRTPEARSASCWSPPDTGHHPGRGPGPGPHGSVRRAGESGFGPKGIPGVRRLEDRKRRSAVA